MDTQGLGRSQAQVEAMADVEMKDISKRVDTRVANAPPLPKLPIYSGETLQDRRVFVRRYTSYYNQLAAFETSLNRPFVMPVSACIEAWTKNQIAAFDMQKPVHEVTEWMWRE